MLLADAAWRKLLRAESRRSFGDKDSETRASAFAAAASLYVQTEADFVKAMEICQANLVEGLEYVYVRKGSSACYEG